MSVADAVIAHLAAQGISMSALCTDSRTLEAGDLFLAYPGATTDGRAYIPEAIARGAAGILWEPSNFEWDAAWALPNLPVAGLKAAAGDIAHRVYGRPSERVDVVGVTGTNGKTSVSHWVAQSMSSAGRPTAVIGTLGGGFPGDLESSVNTTPDAIQTHRWLRRFQEAGARAVAMEVSSIGVDQGRVSGIRFRVGVFTNLSRDHLDYHGSMESYAAAKARFFEQTDMACAVINADDPFGVQLLRRTEGCASHRIAYTLRDAPVEGADQTLQVRALSMDGEGTQFQLVTEGGSAPIRAAVVGRFNVSNVLAVAGALLGLGCSLAEVAEMLRAIQPPAGRMQALGGARAPLVIVDYAHTPDALTQVLTALRPVADARGGRLITVFGAGGDRDPGKRPLMGEIVARLSDTAWVTSDNPRSEAPADIARAILAGMPLGTAVELDRARAIDLAVRHAGERDVVLVAGKGHEPYQEVAGVRQPFLDENEVRRALEARAASLETPA